MKLTFYTDIEGFAKACKGEPILAGCFQENPIPENAIKTHFRDVEVNLICKTDEFQTLKMKIIGIKSIGDGYNSLELVKVDYLEGRGIYYTTLSEKADRIVDSNILRSSIFGDPEKLMNAYGLAKSTIDGLHPNAGPHYPKI